MSEMKDKSFYLKSPCIIKKFNEHDILKNQILNLIEKQDKESFIQKNEYYGDNIEKLDWSKHSDFNRTWVKIFLPYFYKHLNNIANSLGFTNILLSAIWFQQYIKNSIHGWHTHGDNYTGVYYLELDKASPTTEFVKTDTINTIEKVPAEEGDIIIFPSFVKHRAPLVTNDKRKTIISFNFNFDKIILTFLPK